MSRAGPGDDTIALVRRVRAGEPDARNRLLDRLRPRLVLWAATRMSAELRAKCEPEDVAQEVLLAVHKDLDRFDGAEVRERFSAGGSRADPEQGAFFAWLFTIAENRVRDLVDHFDAVKRRQVEPRTIAQPGAEAAAALKEQAQRVRDALSKLSPDHRRVVQHVRLEERDVAEVAKILGRTENAVRILYCRALKELRAELTRGDGK